MLPFAGHPDYFGSPAHYQAVARRAAAALQAGGRSFILVTGDPPPDPRHLADALGHIPELGYAVVIISCGPELTRDDLHRTAPGSAAPLFVFDDFDRLSERQIEEIHEDILRRRLAAIVLARVDFLARLERPGLRMLKERVAAQFGFQKVGDAETITFLHNQLLEQRERRVEARGFRRGMLIGLAAGGVALAVSLGVPLLHQAPEQVCGAPGGAEKSGSVSDQPSILEPPEEAGAGTRVARSGPNAAPIPEVATMPAPLSERTRSIEEEDPRSVIPSAAPPPARQHLEDAPPAASAAVGVAPPAPASPRLVMAEITALLARGDAFLRTGDITSARLFYERAAEADSGLAAFRLATTVDPAYFGRVGLHAAADPAEALRWYRRAHDLGIAEAKQRIKALEARLAADPERSR